MLSQKHKQNESTIGQQGLDESKSVISSTFSLGEPLPVPKSSVDSDAEDEFNQIVEGLQGTKLAEQRPSPVKRPSHPQPPSDRDGNNGDTTGRGSNSATPVQLSADPTWSPNSCIFCNYESPTTPLNVHHMERFHGMFIPEKPFLVDLDGLVQHLQERVSEAHECLYCGKIKSTVYAVQTHMRDTGHCKIPFSTEDEQLEIGEFYDFRSTYSDDDGSDSGSVTGKSGGVKLGAKRVTRILRSDGNNGEDGDGEGWETDSSASSLDSEDLTAVPAEGHIHQFERLEKHRHHSTQDSRSHHQLDGWHSHAHKHTHAAFYDDYELHLPSGKSVGHRSLNKYYRQNLTHYPTPDERAERQAIEESKESDEENRIDADRGRRQQREIIPRDIAGLAGVSDEKKKKVKKAEERGRTAETINTKKTDYAYSKRLNNHKSYYYRFQGGG